MSKHSKAVQNTKHLFEACQMIKTVAVVYFDQVEMNRVVVLKTVFIV